mgnify:CR=1 FL=1
MKTKFLLGFLLVQVLAGCQSVDHLSEENLIDTIIKDKDFIGYMAVSDQHTKQLMAKEFDLDALYPILSDLPPRETPCETPEEALSEVKGGVLWIRNICQIDTHLQALNKKYNYSGLDDELTKRIESTYRDQIRPSKKN